MTIINMLIDDHQRKTYAMMATLYYKLFEEFKNTMMLLKKAFVPMSDEIEERERISIFKVYSLIKGMIDDCKNIHEINAAELMIEKQLLEPYKYMPIVSQVLANNLRTFIKHVKANLPASC